MIKLGKKQVEERVYGPLDYLLTGIYVCLAVYSAGIAVGSPPVAWVFCGLVALGTTFSFLMQRALGDKPIAKLDGWLYMAAGITAIIFGRELVEMLPENPFENQLIVAGAFCWFMAFGSFFTWRDGTLLFQAVPSIALFGMVGVFDTFADAIWLFYAFIVCLATLFARAHRRVMIEQATNSGYKAMLAAEEKKKGVQTKGESALIHAFNMGPWRWMAGPEWALVSALGVILVTMIGAPLVREAAKPISGFVPRPPRVSAANTPALFRSTREDGSVRVGLGPLNVSDRAVARVRMEGLEYLRGRTFDYYQGANGWDNAQSNTGGSFAILNNSKAEIKEPVTSAFWVDLIEPSIGALPLPGDLVDPNEIQRRFRLTIRRDGTVRIPRGLPYLRRVEGRVVNPAYNKTKPRDRGELPEPYATGYLNTQNVSSRVKAWAVQQAVGNTDYERAMELKRAIERTARYNLRAEAVPADVDPVDFFLFDAPEGYCDLFASSMVVTARSIGIPARYVTGFFPMSNVTDPEDPKVWTLQERDAHAWAELYFKDVGWVVFDATEGAIQVPEGERGDATVAKAIWEQEWFGTALNATIGVLLLIGAGIMATAYIRRKNNPLVTVKEIGIEYDRFVRAVEKITGRRRRLSDTPDEFLKLAEPALGGSYMDAKALNEKFVQALYAPGELTKDMIEELRSGTSNLKRSLKSQPPARPKKK